MALWECVWLSDGAVDPAGLFVDASSDNSQLQVKALQVVML